MNQRYGLGATLHGLLPAYTEICDFDPQLFADLVSLRQEKILKILRELNTTASAARYNSQLELMKIADTEANKINRPNILKFYKSECGR